MMTAISVVLGVAIVLLVALASLLEWGAMRPGQRAALALMAGGLTWAGVYRLQAPVTPGDMLFLGGLLVFLFLTYRQPIAAQVDALDGKVDGRLGPIPLTGNVTALKRKTGAALAIAVAIAAGVAGGRSLAHAQPPEPAILRVALRGPGRGAVVEAGRFPNLPACVSARDAVLASAAAHGGRFATPDGLSWTVLGGRCARPGPAD